MLFEEQIRKEYPFKHWIIAVTKFIHLITNIFLNIFHDYINKKNGISLFLLRKLINRINWKIESKNEKNENRTHSFPWLESPCTSMQELPNILLT